MRAQGPKSESAQSDIPSCDSHGQPYAIYCVTCQAVICTRCLVDHHEHSMSDIRSAREKLKLPLINKTKEFKKVQFKLKESLVAIQQVEKDIQRREGLLRTEILKAYNKALEALNAWKSKSLMELETTHSEWYSRCKATVKDLEMNREALERVMMTSRETLSCKHVTFLKDIKQLNISIDIQLSKINNSLQTQEDIKRRLQSASELPRVISRDIRLEETTPKPATQSFVKIIKTSHRELKICDNGSLVLGKSLTDNLPYTAWTNDYIQSGHITWGMEIRVIPYSHHYGCYSRLGVVWKDCDLWSINPGTAVWYIEMIYRNSKVSTHVYCHGDVISLFQEPIMHTWPHRLGFSLNCDECTLIVTDIAHNKVMATVRDIDLSQPVLPAVGFYCWPGIQSVSARIVPWH